VINISKSSYEVNHTAIESSFSLWEKARVRGFYVDLWF